MENIIIKYNLQAIKTIMAFLMLSTIAACQGLDQKSVVPLPVKPFEVEYPKEPYLVDRHWISLQNKENHKSISVFIHLPVLFRTTERQMILPTTDWQQKHAEAIKGKVGEELSDYLLSSFFQSAKNGTSPDTVQFPILVFGPGLGWLPTDYYRLVLPLVSRGIAVATVNAVPPSPVVQFPNGQFEYAESKSIDYHACANNLNLVVEELIRMNSDSAGQFYQRFDTGKIVVGGHSISGAAAYIAAANNKLIKGIVNLDGDVNDEMSKIKIHQPVLYITSQPQGVRDSTIETWADNKSEKRRDTYFIENASLSANAIRIKVPAMGHSDFLDVAVLKKHMARKYIKNRFGSIDPEFSSNLVIDAIYTFVAGKEQGLNWNFYKNKYPQLYVDERSK